MEVDRESVKLSLDNELIKTACNLSMEAHRSQHDDVVTSSMPSVAIFAFKSSMKVDGMYNDGPFGETNVDLQLFPSLQRIGEGQLAKVNGSILHIFKNLLTDSCFKSEVEKAIKEEKKILLTGYSFGGAVASLATMWMLDEYIRKQKIRLPIGCVTFGCPLIGDRIVTHAVQREKWSGHFTHFVMERDIVPRMMLAPKTSNFLKKNTRTHHDLLVDEDQAEGFFENVLINASTVASHDAFDLMEPTNSIKETLSAEFVKFSPYRPFGAYVFCTRKPRQQLVVENPNAVLQLLFYLLQLPNKDQNLAQFALESLTQHLSYEEELNINGLQLDINKMVYLKHLNKHLLTTDGDKVRNSNKALFELTADAKWCLLAVEEAEKRKEKNMDQLKKYMRYYKSSKINDMTKIIEDLCDKIPKYKEKCGDRELDYYEAFKLNNEQQDFEVNVDRLEQAKIWDVIIEMVRRQELPDEFEVWDELVALGTRFRRLYEPLDIANYYRHSKGDSYMDNRPKRYKFTQRWHEHASVMGFEVVSESNFVAVVEDLMKEVITPTKKTFEEVKKDYECIENKVKTWKYDEKITNEDVFWGEFILAKLKEKLA
ncbi:hypothetical protein R6Q59_019864 [Mikania micrantha]|uniref:Fungal lipase-like domain-containing protein n=1 Tax=Mikania micrantha TaxID=192012 RepID=A0A5N6N8J4_9ASTR|nr:hypothetical protein E3N88_25810 [Mikania micrantha]